MAAVLSVCENVRVRIGDAMGGGFELPWMISKLKPSPGGGVGQHHKRGFGPSTALIFFTLPRFCGIQQKVSCNPPTAPPHLGGAKLMENAYIGEFYLQ